MTSSRRLLWLSASTLVFCLLLVLWQLIVDRGLINRVFLPPPTATWEALWRGLTQGDLLYRWGETVKRMFYGWLLASILGIFLGALIGSSRAVRAYMSGILEFFRPLPASAVVPAAIAILGFSEFMVLGVIAFGAVWPTLLATVHGFASVDPRLYEVSASLQMSKRDVAFKIALPNSIPHILSGMRLSITVALILTVVGEMLTSSPGLGSSIMLSARMFQAAPMFAGVILLGITGYATSILLDMAERRLLRWNR